MNEHALFEAYNKAANPVRTPTFDNGNLTEAQKLDEGIKLNDWVLQLAKATAASKEGDKLVEMIEDWIIAYPRSYKGLKPFTKDMIMEIFEANEHIPMRAQEELDTLGIRF